MQRPVALCPGSEGWHPAHAQSQVHLWAAVPCPVLGSSSKSQALRPAGGIPGGVQRPPHAGPGLMSTPSGSLCPQSGSPCVCLQGSLCLRGLCVLWVGGQAEPSSWVGAVPGGRNPTPLRGGKPVNCSLLLSLHRTAGCKLLQWGGGQASHSPNKRPVCGPAGPQPGLSHVMQRCQQEAHGHCHPPLPGRVQPECRASCAGAPLASACPPTPSTPGFPEGHPR